jgi:short-subunit dehydrogenase
VTDEQAVLHLADQAVQKFGKIDVWVNNASVMMFAPLLDAPLADYRRVMDVNFFGYVHGTRAALSVFQAQGNGTLINVSSVVTRMPQPYTSAYVASKHAVHALGQSVRQELTLAGAKDIHVVNVLPAVIDTPLFQHAANYTGRRAKTFPPVYPAENVAKAIVKAATHPKREVYVGNAGRLFNLQMKFMPAMAERAAATMVDKGHLDDTPAPPTSGNLFEPMMVGSEVSGGWKATGSSPARRLATVGAVTVPLAALAQRAWKRQQVIANTKASGGWKAKVADTSPAQRLVTLGATAVPLAAYVGRAWKRNQEQAHADQGPRRVRIETAPEVAAAPEVTTVTETITVSEGTDRRT